MAPSDSADVEQGFALAEGIGTLAYARRSVLMRASIGVGLYYVGVSGHGVAGHAGEQNATVAAAFDGGLGLGLALARHLEAELEVHALLSEPGIGVRFVDVEAARLGRPTLLVTLTLAGWLSMSP